MIKKCSSGAGIRLASALLPGGVIIHLDPSPSLEYPGGVGIYLAGRLGLSVGLVGQTIGWSEGR